MQNSREYTNRNSLDSIYCTANGTRHDARTEEDRQRLDSLRRELEIVVPCQQTLDVLFQFVDGALNYTEIGMSLRCHRGTASRKLKGELLKAGCRWLALQLHKKLVEDGRCAVDPVTAQSIENDSWAIAIPNQKTIFSGVPNMEEIATDLAHKLQNFESFPTRVCLVGAVKNENTHLGLSMLVPKQGLYAGPTSPSDQGPICQLLTDATMAPGDSMTSASLVDVPP